MQFYCVKHGCVSSVHTCVSSAGKQLLCCLPNMMLLVDVAFLCLPLQQYTCSTVRLSFPFISPRKNMNRRWCKKPPKKAYCMCAPIFHSVLLLLCRLIMFSIGEIVVSTAIVQNNGGFNFISDGTPSQYFNTGSTSCCNLLSHNTSALLK